MGEPGRLLCRRRSRAVKRLTNAFASKNLPCLVPAQLLADLGTFPLRCPGCVPLSVTE
ncbi:hypothetical protein IF1G_08606 [Cordyceps javanica]|uniref:Uncharacterized protein n=1 Tax=Cordyceps javanica TaxID=43265 RepID=A0A545UT87_9HYPO|nr:hypothetical protein IF1G_08606 [Cordyceps javanica]